jgi:hypothetical protein
MDGKTLGITLFCSLVCVYPFMTFVAGMAFMTWLNKRLNSVGSGKTLWDVATGRDHRVMPKPKEL